jgi:spore photoproduct lyase
MITQIDRIFKEAEEILEQEPRRFFRFGTGELGDSLAMDQVTGLSSEWISFFSGRKNSLLELKTKTGWIPEQPLKFPDSVVVSWSLNPLEAVRKWERGAVSPEARTRAAATCSAKGFLTGFHFDPVLCFPGWEKAYSRLLENLFCSVSPKRVAWISLGSLRFPPALKEVILSRFPETGILDTEMISGMDGKMRYPRPLREELYSFILNRLREWGGEELWIYYCMESPDVWKRTMGWAPESNADLDFLFAQSLFRRFSSLNMDEPQKEAYPEPQTGPHPE